MINKVRKTLVFGMFFILVFATFVIVQVNVSAAGYQCPSCGYSIEQGIDTCPTCGHEFDWDNHILITDYVNRRVIEVDHIGSSIVWSYYSSDDWWPYDSERLANGNTLIGEVNYYSPADRGRVIEIDASGIILWEMTGLNIVTDVERLDNGNTLICDTHANRVIEVNSAKTIVWKMDSGLRYPVDAERLENGNTLIVDQYHDRVIEVEPDLDIVWETPFVGWLSLQDAERLDSGNTMITSFTPGYQKVYELNPSYVEVWDEAESTYPTDAERLDDGNTLISDGYLSNRVFELDSAGNVVWEVTGISMNWPTDVERLRLINQPPEIAAEFIPIDVEEDEGLFEISFSATDDTDPDPIVTAVIEACDQSIPVENGQLIEIELDDDDCEIEWDDEILEIEALEVYLRVTATDESGNTAEVVVEPVFIDDDSRSLTRGFFNSFKIILERISNLFPILQMLLQRLGL